MAPGSSLLSRESDQLQSRKGRKDSPDSSHAWSRPPARSRGTTVSSTHCGTTHDSALHEDSEPAIGGRLLPALRHHRRSKEVPYQASVGAVCAHRRPRLDSRYQATASQVLVRKIPGRAASGTVSCVAADERGALRLPGARRRWAESSRTPDAPPQACIGQPHARHPWRGDADLRARGGPRWTGPTNGRHVSRVMSYLADSVCGAR